MANIGDRILGQWEPDWFYPGVVVEPDGDGWVVQFDDGGRTTLREDQLRAMNIQPGLKVQSRWKGASAYYSGVVRGVTGMVLRIDYDDGDKEATSVCMIRVNRADC